MKIIDRVDLAGIQPEIIIAVIICNDVLNSYGEEMTITSCKDGEHIRSSKHYIGHAIDIRTIDIPDDTLMYIYDEIKRKLSIQYDVILGENHIHIEYDKKK